SCWMRAMSPSTRTMSPPVGARSAGGAACATAPHAPQSQTDSETTVAAASLIFPPRRDSRSRCDSVKRKRSGSDRSITQNQAAGEYVISDLRDHAVFAVVQILRFQRRPGAEHEAQAAGRAPRLGHVGAVVAEGHERV